MIHYVVCSPISHVSGRLLANAITEIQGRKCRYRNQGRIRHPQRFHVRYGSHRNLCSSNCLNKHEAIELASNKLNALQVLDSFGVAIPPHLEWGEFANIAPYRRIFRKNHRHAGNDSPLIVEKNTLCPRIFGVGNQYDYSLQCIDVEKEFRVHVFKDNAFKYQTKLPREGDNVHPYIRSENRGWRLVSKKDPPRPDGKLGPLAIKAVQALGLDFGAVDVIKDCDGNYFVIEVNTAPGLSERKAMLYAQLMVDWSNNQGV